MVVVGRREDLVASSLAARCSGYEQSYHPSFVGRLLSSYIAFMLIYCASVTASRRQQRYGVHGREGWARVAPLSRPEERSTPIWSRKRRISTCVPHGNFSGILASRSCQNSPAGASPKRPNWSLKYRIDRVFSAACPAAMRFFPANSPAAGDFEPRGYARASGRDGSRGRSRAGRDFGAARAGCRPVAGRRT